MIRHCVFVRFAPDTTPATRTSILAGIAGLEDAVPGLLAVHVGTNVSPEHGMDKGFADGFIIDFADAGARDAYLVDPEHQRVAAELVAAAAGGVDGILVYDLDVG